MNQTSEDSFLISCILLKTKKRKKLKLLITKEFYFISWFLAARPTTHHIFIKIISIYMIHMLLYLLVELKRVVIGGSTRGLPSSDALCKYFPVPELSNI